MRRALLAALAAPALALGACSGSEDGDEAAPTTAAPESEPTEIEGGEDGQAAADVARDFLVAMVNAEPAACDHLLSFIDTERPMTDVPSDHDLCVDLLPEVLRAETEAQGLGADVASSLEGLVIRGADVQGEAAVVDADNYPPDLADAMGDAEVRLKKIDGRWYVDLDSSFAVPTGS